MTIISLQIVQLAKVFIFLLSIEIIFVFLNIITAFFIGSIDLVNKRISKLERKFQKYTQLIAESRASDVEDISDTASIISSRGVDRYQKRGFQTLKVFFHTHSYIYQYFICFV